MSQIEHLEATLSQLFALEATIPFHRLRTRERRALGGHLFPGGPALVEAVGNALSQGPGLYPDVRTTGAALLDAQRRAYRWLFVRDCLQAMAQRAADSYLKEQAEAVREAMAVVQKVKAAPEPLMPFPPDVVERNLLLASAYLMVHAHHKYIEKRKAARRKARQAAAPLAMAAPRRRTAQQRAAAQEDRRDVLGGFFDRFGAFLDQIRETPLPPPYEMPPLGTPGPPPRPFRSASAPPPLTPEAFVASLTPEARETLLRLLAPPPPPEPPPSPRLI